MLRPLHHPVLLVLLCFSLIGTPVTYRGGASNPHPHTFIEFLMEAESGHFDHHHHGDADEHHHDENGPEPGVRRPESEKTTSVVVPNVPVSLLSGQLHQQDTKVSHDDHRDGSSPAPGLRAPDQFRASVSAFVVSDVGQLAYMLPDQALPQSVQLDIAFGRADRLLHGITHSPIVPPPR